MCVWLGTLASWRPGLIGRLVRECRTTAAVLAQDPADIAAFARREVPRRRTRGGEAAASAEQATDEGRFAAALAAGPGVTLQRMESRPPGDLVVAWNEPLYPDQLRDLPDPPLCLFARGGPDGAAVRTRLAAIADAPLVSVVGTRSPSAYGEEMARRLAGDLARRGLTVVSGLALGIDAVAQAAALDAPAPSPAGLPRTVSVLGCGADVVYPRRNLRLYERVVRDGLILSEFAWGVPARAWRFPARNRVMAALGRAVVLVEGARRSGGRITIAHAADLGREVLCVPGEAGRRLSEAPNRLIAEGARVCESVDDVLAAIGVPSVRPGETGEDAPPSVSPSHGSAVRDVLEALQDAPATVDELARRCALSVAAAAATVSGLEIEGLARREDGGRYRLLRV